jgi:simple sugar transport system permease protein
VSDTVETSPGVSGPPLAGPPGAGNPLWTSVKRGAVLLTERREATVFIVAVALVIYFSVTAPQFLTKSNIINITQTTAPWAIIAIGEVMLLVCGEMDLSVGFTMALAPFVMHYLIDFYSFPAILAILVTLAMGVVIGAGNGFLVVGLGVPSFIATLGTSLILGGIVLTTSHAYPANIPASSAGIGHWFGTYAWAEITWTIALVVIFHIVLTRTRWGLHTISVGGNLLGAREAGVSIAKIKMGNFMLTAALGALIGLQESFRVNSIDPSTGGYQVMFYAIAAAVIGGTALAGGSGTIIGAFLGALVLAILTDGFNLIGVSANPLGIIFGSAILLAMIANVYLTRLRRAGVR